ncbi:OstA-like protein [Parabacteroides sp. PF5-9]|uniref:OstA-like protein n=1 Tax=Parabacteroides sp. PF5-9 TaxID=1742404 RepID=UPI002473CA51|nr:OstA-like protein [Parabacteroides sp. PF5-9]MDH6358808.1 lipopolysaccharide export system protein LptA [Parabacteroides sp. PF5-9]
MRRLSYLYATLFCFISVCLSAQTDEYVTTPTDTVKKTKVYLEHSDILSFDQNINPDAQVLTGNVIFRHDSAYMYCDSAYFFELTNSLEAFSNVRMEQGDTLFVYGNYLFYDGNTQIANLRENVRMENRQMTLFTDSLNYDRTADIAYYFEGGLIVDEENELSSYYGQYSPATKMAIFNDSVRLENLQFTLYSDTLHYNTDSKIADILGPSVIESDSGTVYTSRGWYNTTNDYSLLLDRSEIVSGNRILIGDSIIYDRENGYSEVFGNMLLRDTVQKVIMEGQYGFFNERTEYAFATDSARFIEYSQGDTLYLHADTLEMATVDSTFREIKAYYGVRFFRTDLQGVCDSMQFNTKDSVMFMYNDPIVWNEAYQLYGDTIVLFMNDSTIDYAHVRQFAFAVQLVDTTYYNQLKGNDLKAFFEGKTVRQIDVEGNAESIFYPLEESGAMIGLNETKSGFLSIWVHENKLEKLKIWPSPTGSLTPIPDLDPTQKTLKDFYWFDYIRPQHKDDIYQVVRRKEGEAPKRSNKFIR